MWSLPRLAAFALAVSAALSLAILACRNLFDDELLSLAFVMAPAREIVAIAREGDVHPPGMYLLAHVAWRIVGSYRWLNLLPAAVLYAGLAMFVLAVTPRFAGTRTRVCFLLLATLHPELLMWGSTFRWYCPWTGVALAAIVVALEPSAQRPRLGWGRAMGVGLMLAALFYLNYITLLFAVALGAAMLVRYRELGAREKVLRGGLLLAAFLLPCLPQLGTMAGVHLAAAGRQRFALPLSVVRLAQAIGGSEAYLPWHPVALVSAVVAGVLGCVGVLMMARMVQSEVGDSPDECGSALRSLLVCGGIFALLIAGTGLGGKPRSGLLLAPLFAVAVALGFARLGRGLQMAVLLLVALWVGVGAAHLVGRYGLAKGGMNDRPEQVVAFLRGRVEGGACGVVATYDSGLAFALAEARIPRLMVLSPFRGAPFAAAGPASANCAEVRVYAVASYLEGGARKVRAYDDELGAAEGMMTGAPEVTEIDADPDAGRKRRLARWAGVEADAPAFRFVVRSGRIGAGSVGALLEALPDFRGGRPEGF